MKLFQHNREAYEAAVRMLAAKGKACVIHPTGTGKSYIGFALCLDHPDKRILWLSPSSYIFQTQLENLKRDEAAAPENIIFYTYAKLTFLSEEEIGEIKPDYIILDEFHRVGAVEWFKSVMKILVNYSEIPLLGLSATNIRYLDNRRDMAQEIFDGNIASEMTLGEAIVRGILKPPKYVLSIYSWQQELRRYEERIGSTRNKAARDEAGRYLEALRRALGKADGVEEIFAKNMDDPTGKYIVFCADHEHMQEVISCEMKGWLSGVSTNYKVYTFYSGDTESDASFRAFCGDQDDSRMRLLFCIDALNEGVHVEDISGVILLRPTVSPIVYKQQIGRALSAAGTKNPVIFDIVNNIEGLCSIDGVKEEMEEAIRHFHSTGEEKEIVNERFAVAGRLEECRKLFGQLEATLSEGWNLMWEKAREYYQAHGDLEVPRNDETEREYSGLNAWLTIQRRVYNGKIRGSLTQAQIIKLESVGMRWMGAGEAGFLKYIEACKTYKNEYGNLLVPVKYETEDGLKLGEFLARMRMEYKHYQECAEEERAVPARAESVTVNDGEQYQVHQKKDACFSQEAVRRFTQLDEIGMIWDIKVYKFRQYYACAAAYYRRHGHSDIPTTYVDADTGLAVGRWLNGLRKNRESLSREQMELLEAIHFSWTDPAERKWGAAYAACEEYYRSHGNLKIPSDYMGGLDLSKWLSRQRKLYEEGRLSEERTQKLSAIGMSWAQPDSWEERFALVAGYYREHGNLNIPQELVVDGVWLYKWLNKQINAGEGKGKKPLTGEQKEKLASIGICFDGKRYSDRLWEERVGECRAFFAENGHLNVTKDENPPLFRWLGNVRSSYRNGKLDKAQIAELEAVGIRWQTASEQSFAAALDHIKAYYRKNGNLEVAKDYVCADGYRLGGYIANARSKYKRGKLTSDQIAVLEQYGMIWDYKEFCWNRTFEKAQIYFKRNGCLPRKFKVTFTDEEKEIYEWIRGQIRYDKDLTQKKAEKMHSIGIELESEFSFRRDENRTKC